MCERKYVSGRVCVSVVRWRWAVAMQWGRFLWGLAVAQQWGGLFFGVRSEDPLVGKCVFFSVRSDAIKGVKFCTVF
jgi:hypothetical protein